MASEESKILVAIAELKGQISGLNKDFKSLQDAGLMTRQSVEDLRRDINGRFKKLEHTVFGNDDTEKVGIVEKIRGFDDMKKILSGDEGENILPLPERIRNLESGWAKLTTIAVLACSVGIEAMKWGGHFAWNFLQSRSHP